MNGEFFYPLKAITTYLDGFSVPYMLTGGLAQNVYIKPRQVNDIDIVVDSTGEFLGKTLPSISNQFEFRRIHRKIQFCGMFNTTHSVTQKKVDIIICKSTEFNRLEFKNKTKKNILGLELNCTKPEDLIISKLIWVQDFKMDKHLVDLTQLLNYPGINLEYIKYWINELGLDTHGIFQI